MSAEEPYIKKDKMTIKISKRNKIINKMHKNDRNIDCSFDIIMLNKVETNQTPQKKGGNTV